MQLSHNWLFLGVVNKMDPVCITVSFSDFFSLSHSGRFVFVFDIFTAFLNLVCLDEMNVLITLSI